MKYIVLTLLSILLLCTSVRAQAVWEDIRIDLRRNTVVATGGLNLRAEPSTKGKIVAKLPFTTEVKILEEALFNPDSVNQFNEWVQPFGWAKVRFGQDVGYLYDAYLYYSAPTTSHPPEDEWPEGINTKYRLITNAGDANKSYDVFSYKWYGLYREATNCNLQYIKPTFSYFAGEVEETLDMIANTKTQPVFFIGSPKTLPTGFRGGWVGNMNGQTAEAYGELSEKACAANGITVESAPPGSWISSNKFILKVGNITQHLTPGGKAGTAQYLEAVGDFDGDGKTDFIISYDTVDYDSTVTYALFLSSEARPGELVRPVAMQYSYNGC